MRKLKSSIIFHIVIYIIICVLGAISSVYIVSSLFFWAENNTLTAMQVFKQFNLSLRNIAIISLISLFVMKIFFTVAEDK